MPYSPEQMNEMFMQVVMGGLTAVINQSVKSVEQVCSNLGGYPRKPRHFEQLR